MPDIKALGIDVGSTTVKIVGVDAEGAMLWHLLEPTDPRIEEQVEQFLERAREATPSSVKGSEAAPSSVKGSEAAPSSVKGSEAAPSSVKGSEAAPSPGSIPLVATGYGRKLVHQATRRVTEITCHARGVYRELQHGGTLVDIGGQDSKAIRIGPEGNVMDFVMNDKCAAGTGRFLENTVGRLGVELDCMGELALSVAEEATISSTCTVFAETEVISLIARGVSVAAILRGLHRSLIKRLIAMIRTVGLAPPLMLSGGVVQNPAIRRMLEEEIGEKVVLPRYPQLMGAYGAALFALGADSEQRQLPHWG